MTTPDCWRRLAELPDKLALELVFAEAGKDAGLLPLNSLLAEFEELSHGASLPAALLGGVRQARAWVDGILDGGGYFDDETLAKLRHWVRWLQQALPGAQAGQTVPALPEWEEANRTVARTPSETRSDAATPGEIPPLEMNLERDRELLVEFCHESREHLQNIEDGVLTLEQDPTNADTLNSIFRAFHTFKGGSGFLNLAPVNRLAHELESLLDQARHGQLLVTAGVVQLILEGGDVLTRFIAGMEDQLSGRGTPAPIVIPVEPLIARVHALMTHAPGAPGGSPPPSTPATGEHTEPRVLADAESGGKSAGAAALAAPSTAVPGRVPSAAPANPAARSSAQVGLVKVDTQKLDNLLDLVGELVISESLLAQAPEWCAGQSPALARNLAQLSRITKELQRTAMSLRLVPIRATFQKMKRLVHDLAASQGKKVELTISGEETELDRSIIEEINDPLIHMIRNAMDHGLEVPEMRAKLGKPPQGAVRLRAFHEAGAIGIQIQDDGAGLNKERILAKARQQGLIGPADELEDQEVFQLIFAPGFSTADQVTALSGRGVGMDVVRRNIERLRGKIEIQSTPGQGSSFTILLPLTLAIIDGLVVGVGEQRFILPTLSVRESFQPAADGISVIQGRGEVVSLRGRLIPLLRLRQFLDLPPEPRGQGRGIGLIVESGHQCRCLLVDRLLGKQEVVIKSLGRPFHQAPLFAGATILGDGRVGLILDPSALVTLASERLAAAA